jgi:hypothetical protein
MLVGMSLTLPTAHGAVGERYLSDMSLCRPAAAHSTRQAAGKWRLTAYKSKVVSGTLLSAASFIAAPEVTLPLDATGWHAVYLGYWHPEFAYDGGMVLKAKFSGDAAFRRIHDDQSPDTQDATYLREVYLDTRDLTGKRLIVGKCNGLLGRAASLAYVRLVPLTPEQTRATASDRARRDTRNLVATIDGMSYFHFAEHTRPEHILEQVELYRDSDVGKVLWAATYGGTTNYPTRVPDATFMGSDAMRARLMPGAGSNDYVRGEKQSHDALRAFAAQGIIPQQLAAEHVHRMGLKFDLMFRLGILGGVGPWSIFPGTFVRRHPECRQVTREGAIVEKASYAFPEVQQFTLSLMREALGKVNADGANLCFARGPHFLLYEQPVLDAFRARFGEDARDAEPTDPRLLQVRATIMTGFVRQARALLDEAGRAKGRHLELSAWVWPSAQRVWLGGTPLEEGLDVKAWIREGLLDSVICQEGVDPDYMELGAESGCRFVLFTGYGGEQAMSPGSVTSAYVAGVRDFAYWDIDAAQLSPGSWNWLRRIGHREEMADWERFGPGTRLIQLTEVGGADVLNGLAGAVYSGG